MEIISTRSSLFRIGAKFLAFCYLTVLLSKDTNKTSLKFLSYEGNRNVYLW